jgi:hypothetical protein
MQGATAPCFFVARGGNLSGIALFEPMVQVEIGIVKRTGNNSGPYRAIVKLEV